MAPLQRLSAACSVRSRDGAPTTIASFDATELSVLEPLCRQAHRYFWKRSDPKVRRQRKYSYSVYFRSTSHVDKPVSLWEGSSDGNGVGDNSTLTALNRRQNSGPRLLERSPQILLGTTFSLTAKVPRVPLRLWRAPVPSSQSAPVPMPQNGRCQS